MYNKKRVDEENTWNYSSLQPLISRIQPGGPCHGMQFKVVIAKLSACCVSHEQGIRSNLGWSQQLHELHVPTRLSEPLQRQNPFQDQQALLFRWRWHIFDANTIPIRAGGNYFFFRERKWAGSRSVSGNGAHVFLGPCHLIMPRRLERVWKVGVHLQQRAFIFIWEEVFSHSSSRLQPCRASCCCRGGEWISGF